MSAICPICEGPLGPNEVHDGQADCDAAAGPTGLWRANHPAIVPRGTSELLSVPIDQVATESNVRADLGDLEELAASIRSEGLLQPIAVHRRRGALPGDLDQFPYVVDHGHRRLAACKLAGLTEIPVIVSEPRVGVDRPIAQLVENLQRRDLNPLEEAEAFRAILDADPKLKQADLAGRIGRSAPYVSNALRLLELDPEVRALVTAGQISGSHAKALAALPAGTSQLSLARQAVENGYSSHHLEVLIGYRLRDIDSAQKQAKRTEKAIAKALERLVADGVSMTEPLMVSCSYELNTDAVKTALRTAGFTLHDGWRSEPRDKVGCECATLRLEVNGNAGIGLVTVCVNADHLDALYGRRQSENNTKHAAEEVMLDELEAAALAIWKASPPHPIIARLLLRYVENYAGKTWTEYMALDPADILGQLMSRAVGSAHGAKPLPVKSVLLALVGTTEQGLAAERVAAKRAARRATAWDCSCGQKNAGWNVACVSCEAAREAVPA